VPSLTKELSPPEQMQYKLNLNDVTMAADCTKDMNCIDFEPETLERSMEFSDFLKQDLMMRNMLRLGNLEQQREALHDRLIQEKDLDTLRKTIDHCNRYPEALVKVMKLIPCILHLEIRFGIEILSMVLAKGLDSINNQPECLSQLEKIMQTKILDDADAPVDWFFPAEKEKNNNNGESGIRRDVARLMLGDIRLTNAKVRKVITNFDLITDACVTGEEEKNKHKQCVSHYKNMMAVPTKHTDYTDDEISSFKEESHEFIIIWMELYGYEGCTHYIHILSCGHVLLYMVKYKCLYRYSQQWWEALDAVLTSYLFRRTKRGGTGKGSEEKTKLMPIARWIQRRIMWITGLGDAVFADVIEDTGIDDTNDAGHLLNEYFHGE
jgi:hypothetical protein